MKNDLIYFMIGLTLLYAIIHSTCVYNVLGLQCAPPTSLKPALYIATQFIALSILFKEVDVVPAVNFKYFGKSPPKFSLRPPEIF